MKLTPADTKIVLAALNDREGVLSTDWQRAAESNSVALAASIAAELGELRRLASALQLEQALRDIVSCCDANCGDSLANAVNDARALLA